MPSQRMSVRFTTDELAGIASRAAVLEINKTDVVRLAVQALFTNTKASEAFGKKIDEMRLELRSETKSEFAQIREYQKRSTRLMLKVLKAPKEAEDALIKIFGE
jgi:hypothetical protein